MVVVAVAASLRQPTNRHFGAFPNAVASHKTPLTSRIETREKLQRRQQQQRCIGIFVKEAEDEEAENYLLLAGEVAQPLVVYMPEIRQQRQWRPRRLCDLMMPIGWELANRDLSL